MVHALETVHGLLAPGGRVIDIHPLTDRAEIDVRAGDAVIPAGRLRESNGGIEYVNAERALAAVIQSGLFALAGERTSSYVHHARSLAELREHLARTRKDAIIDDDVAARIELLLGQAGPGGEVLLREQPRMTRLEPGGVNFPRATPSVR